MRKITLFILSIFFFSFASIEPDEILKKVDANMSSRNRISTSTMTVYGKRSNRVITAKSWAVGTQKALTEYLSPASEKGTKMLKLQGQLWIYSPSTDRIIQISGHMLRQSVMGSDMSYEDFMDDRKLTDIYTSKNIGEEKIGDRNTWILELTAKVADVAYYSQKVWIDQERYVPLKQELYAKSGQLLKRVELKDIQKIQNRWFPTCVIYKDMLKDGKGTEFKMSDIKFDQDIPEYIFSKASLKQ